MVSAYRTSSSKLSDPTLTGERVNGAEGNTVQVQRAVTGSQRDACMSWLSHRMQLPCVPSLILSCTIPRRMDSDTRADMYRGLRYQVLTAVTLTLSGGIVGA